MISRPESDLSPDDLLVELLGEGMHTAFRKASDCPQASRIYQLISAMPGEEWRRIVEFVAEGVRPALHVEEGIG